MRSAPNVMSAAINGAIVKNPLVVILGAESEEAAGLDVDCSYLAVGLPINGVHSAELPAIGGENH